MFNRKYILKGSIFQPAMLVSRSVIEMMDLYMWLFTFSCLSLGVKVNFSDLNKPHCSNGVVEGSTLNMPLNLHWIYIRNINIVWFIYIGQFSNLHLFLCGYVLSKTALKQKEFVGCCEKNEEFPWIVWINVTLDFASKRKRCSFDFYGWYAMDKQCITVPWILVILVSRLMYWKENLRWFSMIFMVGKVWNC